MVLNWCQKVQVTGSNAVTRFVLNRLQDLSYSRASVCFIACSDQHIRAIARCMQASWALGRLDPQFSGLVFKLAIIFQRSFFPCNSLIQILCIHVWETCFVAKQFTNSNTHTQFVQNRVAPGTCTVASIGIIACTNQGFTIRAESRFKAGVLGAWNRLSARLTRAAATAEDADGRM